MVLELANASYRHGFDAEVRASETNGKKYNVDQYMLCMFGARAIKVKRTPSLLASLS